MKTLATRFLLPSLVLFLAPDKGGGGGGDAAKPLSLDAQLTASQTRVTELEGLQTTWGQEQTRLTGELTTAQNRVTELQGQLTTATNEQTRLGTRVTELEGQLTTANGSITTLSSERDRFKTLSETPSAQARGILAAAGGAAVAMRPDGTKNPAETTVAPAANLAGKTGLKAAIAKMNASAAERKQ